MIDNLNVKIFADGADLSGMLEMYAKPYIKGFTTNPTLMRKAGVVDYQAFAKEVIRAIPDRPLSFEVFTDEFNEMGRQARKIASWGDNVYVKIPISNTHGKSSASLVKALSADGVKVNVTAIMTTEQVKEIADSLDASTPAYISVFAGRVADTGRDPLDMMKSTLDIIRSLTKAELIWASPREILNIIQADSIGCHVITVTNDILKKVSMLGYDLDVFSLETVKMFHNDANSAGYTL